MADKPTGEDLRRVQAEALRKALDGDLKGALDLTAVVKMVDDGMPELAEDND